MNVLKHMIRFRRANGDDVEDYKQPDMYIFQYTDGTFKCFNSLVNSFKILNPRCHIQKHGKIICKFKVYRK